MKQRSEKAWTAEDGLTLIELIVAASMMIVITGAAVAMLVSALNRQPKVTERADQIGDARIAIERIAADLRQGKSVSTPTASGLTLSTFCDNSAGVATACTVVYACAAETVPQGRPAAFRCTRQVNSAAAQPLVTGLASNQVFCYVPSTSMPNCGTSSGEPAYVGLTVQLVNAREGSTVLEGGAALHNATSYRGS